MWAITQLKNLFHVDNRHYYLQSFRKQKTIRRYHKFKNIISFKWNKSEAANERKNKEKYCCFWYEWQLVERSKKFELWLDVESRKDSFFALFSINLFPTTLLNAKQCNFLSFASRLFFGMMFSARLFIAADCEYVNNRKVIYLCPSNTVRKRQSLKKLIKSIQMGIHHPNNMRSSLRVVYEISFSRLLLFLRFSNNRKLQKTYFNISALREFLASERRKSNSLFWWHLIKKRFSTLLKTKKKNVKDDSHLDVYYVKDLQRIYDVIMNITTFIWPDDNTQWSRRQAFY